VGFYLFLLLLLLFWKKWTVNFSFKSLFAVLSLSPQRLHYYFYLSIVSWQYQKNSTILILVLYLLCVTPLVCSSYSSSAPSSHKRYSEKSGGACLLWYMDVLIVRVCVGVLMDESCFCLVKIIKIIKDTSETTRKTLESDIEKHSNIICGCVDCTCVCWCIDRWIMFLSGENHKNHKRHIGNYSQDIGKRHRKALKYYIWMCWLGVCVLVYWSMNHVSVWWKS